MRLVFIGPPGAGKGTQCQRLAEHFQIPHLSTGQMLRHAKASQSPLGKIVGPILDSGSLVNDDTMNKIVRERIGYDDCANGFILDGYPRTVPQADSLTQFLEPQNPLDAAILIDVECNELIRRLNQRFLELENPRPEDQPTAIPKRLDIYEEVTRPLIEYYQSCIVCVDGAGTPDQVFTRLLEGLDQAT